MRQAENKAKFLAAETRTYNQSNSWHWLEDDMWCHMKYGTDKADVPVKVKFLTED